FAALDAFTREELWCVLRDLWQRLGFTVILVTHDLREATFLADNIHAMSARPGHIVMTKKIDLPRPRDLDICFEPRFTDIVHELRVKIAEVRKACTRHWKGFRPGSSPSAHSCCGSSFAASSRSIHSCCRRPRRYFKQWANTGCRSPRIPSSRCG